MSTRTWLAMGLAALVLASCGKVTGPPATGAGSSAPDAVESAKGGSPGGGAAPNTNGNVDPQTLKQSP